MSPIKLAKVEVAPRIVLSFYDAFNRHDIDAMIKLVSEDFLLETAEPAPDGIVYSGKDAAARFWRDYFRESPQARIEIEELIGSGFRCVLRWRSEWTDAAGMKKHLRGADIFRVQNGLICEKRSYKKG